jgi:hypothetical protein
MTTYSFRAECPHDLQELTLALRAHRISCSMNARQDPQFPDYDVEMESDAPLETIRAVMRDVTDGHVMVQTLRACPLAENCLERDYSL